LIRFGFVTNDLAVNFEALPSALPVPDICVYSSHHTIITE
jgi:hypothetical protein